MSSRKGRVALVANALLVMLLSISVVFAYHYYSLLEPRSRNASKSTHEQSSESPSTSACQSGPRASCATVDLVGIRSDFKDLTQIKFEGAVLVGSNFEYASMQHVNMIRAKVASSNLRNAYLVGANLTSANLAGSNLTVANIKGANLAGAFFCLAMMPDGTLNNINCQT